MSDTAIAEEFLKRYGPDYLTLLRNVQDVCEEVKRRLGQGFVDDIYTRKTSTGKFGNFAEFKDASAIGRKIRRRGDNLSVQAFLNLNDIVGMTVVVYYPDLLERIITEVRQSLSGKTIDTSEPEYHRANNGYFATHVICEKYFLGTKLRCEIQFKTILHDAWSAKMHDLTYKPMGMLDPRLSALMASVADTIESLENQSRLIREMIHAGWNVEETTRRIARQKVFEGMLKYEERIQQAPNNAALVKLYRDIEDASSILEKESDEHPTTVGIMQCVGELCRNPAMLRYGWTMAGRIASLRSVPELSRFFMEYADMWLTAAPGLLADSAIDESEISAVPVMFYVIGDLDRAIDYAFQIRNTTGLSAVRKARIDFNRATFLAEREYHFPTQDPLARAQLREEIDEILKAPALCNFASENADGKSALLDTEGFVKITFAKVKEDARLGIEDCVAARALSSESQKSVADAYADLNMRLGWRRYFELEIRERQA